MKSAKHETTAVFDIKLNNKLNLVVINDGDLMVISANELFKII
jgi:hypothetical protein